MTKFIEDGYNITMLVLVSIIAGIPALLLIVLFGLTAYQNTFKPVPHQTKVEYTDYGIVRAVEQCHASKYSYNCFVYTNKVTFKYSVDITKYPGETIQVGDSLGYQQIWYDDSGIGFYHCRNKMCTLYATKPWFVFWER